MGPRPGQKTVLITGCTPGGIGHALCLEFHKQGLYVIATARKSSVLAEMAGMGMSTLQLDVTNADSIASCALKVKAITGGKLDILVNNAGRTHTHPALDLDMDDVRETFESNIFGVMAMVAAFGDHLIAAKGLVINIASLAAVTPYVFGAAYSASKGAVVSYSRTLRQELKPFGVRVMVGMAGTVKSNIASHSHRMLPEGSVYERVRDLFEKRLVFSQNNSSMSTESYATELVRHALKSEVPWFMRSWFGRPDWFWCGGLAKTTWWGSTLFGEVISDFVSYRMFGLTKLQKMVQADERARKLK